MRKAILFLLLAFALLCLGACRANTCDTHRFAAWSVRVEPSCTQEGEEFRVCRICDFSESRAIPKLDHTLLVVAGHSSSCTEEGLSDGMQCTVCGEWALAQTALPTREHRYQLTDDKSFYVLSEQKERYCTYCCAFVEGSQVNYGNNSGNGSSINRFPIDKEFEDLIKNDELIKYPVDILDKDKTDDFLKEDELINNFPSYVTPPLLEDLLDSDDPLVPDEEAQ